MNHILLIKIRIYERKIYVNSQQQSLLNFGQLMDHTTMDAEACNTLSALSQLTMLNFIVNF